MEKIRQGYREKEGKLQSPPWCDEFNFSLESLFTRLRIVKKVYDDQPTRQIDHLTDIFRVDKYGQEPRTVLIEGKSGMGKTTYCQKLAYDWASKQEELEKLLPQIQVLLSLKCGEISSDIWNAVDAQLLPEDVDEQSKEMFFNFIQENQSIVLLILDGLDDMSPDKLQMIYQLIKREYPQCHFVLTAERATTMEVREYCDTWLEIVGFTEEDGKKFISDYFKDQESLAKKLFDLLDEYDNLRRELFLGNPIYTALLCLLCKDLNGVFPTSSTQLYTEMILCALRRYETIKGKSSSDEDLIEVYKDHLTSLGLIAFNYQRKRDLDLEEDEGTINMEDLPEFGFTSAQTVRGTRRPRLWYGFQQFFAGFFLAFQILSGEIDLNAIVADESYFEPPLRQVFLFMSGILSLESEEKALDLVKIICSRINSLALGNAEEIEELQMLLLLALECSEYAASEHRNNYILTLGSSLKLEILAIGGLSFPCDYHDMLKSKEFKWLQMYPSYPIYRGCPSFARLSRTFSEALKYNTTLNTLHLSDTYGALGPLGAKALSGALKVNSSLTNLNLRFNQIGASGAQALSDALEINTTLTKLDLSDNDISASGTQFLSKALEINASLTSLNLCHNKIGEQRQGSRPRPREINMIPILLQLGRCTFPEALEKLDEFSTGMDETMDDYGLFSLSESLKTNTTLTNLNLKGNEIDCLGAHYLSECLKTNATLTTLNLSGNRLSSFGTKCLSLALRTNGTLTSLDVSDTSIDAQALCEALKVNATLTSLDLTSNGFGDSGAQAVSDVLQGNATLMKLRLTQTRIGAKGTQYICEALARNDTLTSLDFSFNKIGGAGALFFSEALQNNNALNELNLKFTEVDERGAICLFDALKHNTTLSTLDLTGLCAVFYPSKGSIYLPFRQLSDTLKVNATLTCLRLGQNDMRSPDVQVFFTALMDNKTLKELDLDGVRSRFKVPPPEFLASNTALTYLNLSSSLCDDASALTSFFKALTVNSTLTRLKLKDVDIMDSTRNRSNIGDSECELISETLKENTTLTDLDLSCNRISDVGIRCIMEALKINTTLKYLNLTGQREKYRAVTYSPSLKKVNTSICVSW